MANVPVDWGVLTLNHPSWRTIRDLVPNIPKGWETCCIQMSYALNRAGAPIRNRGGVVGLQSGNENFIINVPTMRGYLDAEFGTAENFVAGSRIARISQFVDRFGILAFGDRHIDLWDGTQLQRPSDYIPSAIWEHRTALVKGLFFWEVT
jgi:type VI secretion system (T6SS) effector Tae4 (amidase)